MSFTENTKKFYYESLDPTGISVLNEAILSLNGLVSVGLHETTIETGLDPEAVSDLATSQLQIFCCPQPVWEANKPELITSNSDAIYNYFVPFQDGSGNDTIDSAIVRQFRVPPGYVWNFRYTNRTASTHCCLFITADQLSVVTASGFAS